MFKKEVFKIKSKPDKNYDEENTTLTSFSFMFFYILNNYSINARKGYLIKRILKIIFFMIVMLIMMSLVALFGYSLCMMIKFPIQTQDKSGDYISNLINAIVPVLTTLVSLIIALVKIPEIIAEYLFNPKEDEYMSEVIKNIQNFELKLEEFKKSIPENLDDDNIDARDAAESEPSDVQQEESDSEPVVQG